MKFFEHTSFTTYAFHPAQYPAIKPSGAMAMGTIHLPFPIAPQNHCKGMTDIERRWNRGLGLTFDILLVED